MQPHCYHPAMRAFATIRVVGPDHQTRSDIAATPDPSESPDDGAQTVELQHGDLVGRLETAALTLDDGRVSEAHAMVSLRNGALKLLALRRRFSVDGDKLAECDLEPGLAVDITPEWRLEVVDVRLPDEVAILRWTGGEAPLLHDVASIVTDPVRIEWRWLPEAAGRLWRLGDRWRVDTGGGPRPLATGDHFEAAGTAFSMDTAPIASVTSPHTRGVRHPLTWESHYDTVHVHRSGQRVLSVSGRGARLLAELLAMKTPVSWIALARQLWRGDVDEHLLRARMDALLYRLRRKLREAHLDPHLVRSDGFGNLELLLQPDDVVQDQS